MEKKIKYSIVSRKKIKNKKEFIEEWNYTVKENSIVVLIFHGGPYHIYTTSDSFKAGDVKKLKNKKMSQLRILACNCGHKDVKDNIAKKIKARLTKTEAIYAMDGSISYYLPKTNYKGYKPRLSVDQHNYYKYASIVTYRNKYGSIIRVTRAPIGLYKV